MDATVHVGVVSDNSGKESSGVSTKFKLSLPRLLLYAYVYNTLSNTQLMILYNSNEYVYLLWIFLGE